jgi:hypothetical protein
MDRDASKYTQVRDPYQILGMPRTATADDVNKRFRRLAMALHPDMNKEDPNAAERFAELNSAREILANKHKRKAFDRGEIDAEGNPARGISYVRYGRFRSNLNKFSTGLVIAGLVLAATPTLLIRNLTVPGAIEATGSSDSLLSRFGVDEAHANAALPERLDNGLPSESHLIFQKSVSRAADGSFPLGVQVSGAVVGYLEISGLPSGMTISSGHPVGTGRWRILAGDMGSAMVHPPQGFDGTADLNVELRRSDDTVADHRALHVRSLPRPAVAARDEATAGALSVSSSTASKRIGGRPTDRNVARNTPPKADREQIDFLVKRGVGLISEGDIVAARIVLQRAAEARDARAAFALGVTYDPIMLTMLQAHGVAADPRVALDWYKKASEFGSREAVQRLNVLAALH